jgi:gamma-glutamylcyclotransferase (GGCT)/AIG2-like uncharacterized protein YtfP
MYVSVYGTLKRGHGNNYILANCEFVTTGIVRGLKLYNSGFPVAAPSEGDSATVEIWKIPDEDKKTLTRLDGLEGHRGNEEDSGSMYFRHTKTIHGDDGETYEADIYVGNPKTWRGFQGMRVCDATDRTYTWGR